MTQSPYNADPDSDGPGPTGYLALVLAWACPGLGHLILGHRARGLVFAVTIHALFAAGLLVGGIRAINPPDQAIWTYTQFLTGWPMLIANRVQHASERDLVKLQQTYESDRPNSPDDRRRYANNFISQHPVFAYHPKVQDIGAVYCGIAGMLNLLVMFDVLLLITNSTREVPAAFKRPPASPATSPPVPAPAQEQPK